MKAIGTVEVARRNLLRIGGAGLLGAALFGAAGCAGDSGGGGGKLRMTWWGPPERHKRTKAALKIIEGKQDGLSIDAQYGGFQGYFDKLATQTAGGNAPELFGMTTIFLTEYAERGALLELDQHAGDALDLANLDQDAVDGGKVNGKIYGLPLGMNAYALDYDATALDRLGVSAPDRSWTWQEFARFAAEVSEAGGDDFYGTADFGGAVQPFEVFIRQRGGNVYDDQGGLGFGEDDLADWFDYWERLRKSGAAVPPEITAESAGLEASPLVTGKAAIQNGFSDQHLTMSNLTENDLRLISHPLEAADSTPGAYVKPAVLISAYSKADNKKEAVTVIDGLLNDEKVGQTLGMVAYGVPPSSKVQAGVQQNLSEEETASFEYIQWVSENSGDVPPQRPPGAGEVDNMLLGDVNQRIAFGKLSVSAGVKRFFSEAKRILG